MIAMTGMLLVPDTILRSLAAGRGSRRDHRRCRCDDAAACRPLAARRPGRRAAPARSSAAAPARAGSGGWWSSRGAAPAAGQPRSHRPRSWLRSRCRRSTSGPGSAGVRTIPDGYASKDGFNALERELGVGTVDTAEIVVEGDVAAPAVRQGIERLRAALASDTRLPDPGARDRAGREPGGGRGARRRRQPRRALGAGDRAAPHGGRAARRSATPTSTSTSPARRRRSSTTAS